MVIQSLEDYFFNVYKLTKTFHLFGTGSQNNCSRKSSMGGWQKQHSLGMIQYSGQEKLNNVSVL